MYVFFIFLSDLLKLRFVELLAASASKKDFVGRPEDVDESYLCGCPGKIVDAELLHEILKGPADEHVFFGMGEPYTTDGISVISSRTNIEIH